MMTTPSPSPLLMRRAALEDVTRRSLFELWATSVALAAALPLALVAGEGFVRAIGLVYALFYLTFILLPGSGPILWLTSDAIRIARRRTPIYLPQLVLNVQLIRRRAARSGVPFRPPWWLRLIALANPLVNLAICALAGAARLRPREFVQSWEGAIRAADLALASIPDVASQPVAPAPEDPAVAFSRPVWRQIELMERELQVC